MASSNKRIYGIKAIYIGDVQDDGLMPDDVDLVEIGKLVYESIELIYEENTITDIKNQETGKVDLSIMEEEGAKKFSFATRDMQPDNLILAFGGSFTAGKYNYPKESFVGREKAVRIVTKAANGLHGVIDFPRMKLNATITGAIVENATVAIAFTGTMLMPVNASDVIQTPQYIYYQPAAPTNGVVDNTANTFAFDYVDQFEDPTLYEYSINTGSTYSAVTVNPITGLSGAIGIGDLLVRVKASLTVDEYVAGYTLANDTAYTT